MTVLVTYASKYGGTEGLAEMMVKAFTEEGVEAVARPAREVGELAGFDAVVVGGGLYAGRWGRDARRFVRRHAEELRGLPVWFFSDGPLDDSASEKDIPPAPGVRSRMEKVGAVGHATFGGYLPEDARGFPAAAIAKRSAGDYRDPEQVARWVHGIVTELRQGPGRADAA